MSKCREAKRGVSMSAPRDGHGRKQKVGGQGSQEGDAGALQSRWSFRCRGNPSAACVASAQQCASDSQDPVKSRQNVSYCCLRHFQKKTGQMKTDILPFSFAPAARFCFQSIVYVTRLRVYSHVDIGVLS